MSVTRIIEVHNMIEPREVGSDNSMEWESLERDHPLYAFLARALTSFKKKSCIFGAIGASSTDHYPFESIENTLEPSPVLLLGRGSYWSSKGECDPTIPETLTYRLISKLCVVTEINIHPFKDSFQINPQTFSAKAVRFRMGLLREPVEARNYHMDEFSAGQRSADTNFISTYISPEFHMAQENRLQEFKLPEPVLCIGGILQIELLGRVQRHEWDGLFYIWRSLEGLEGVTM